MMFTLGTPCPSSPIPKIQSTCLFCGSSAIFRTLGRNGEKSGMPTTGTRTQSCKTPRLSQSTYGWLITPRPVCLLEGQAISSEATLFTARREQSLFFHIAPVAWPRLPKSLSPPTPRTTSAATNLIMELASSCFRHPVDHRTCNNLFSRPQQRNFDHLFVRASLYHVGLCCQRGKHT